MQTGFGTRPASVHLVHVAVSSRVKRTRRDADYLHLSSAEVKNAWSYTSSPPYAFVACIRTTLPLLLPLNDFQYHFKRENQKIQEICTRHEDKYDTALS
jgi:hypothetical protein